MYWDDKYGTQSVSNEASWVLNLFIIYNIIMLVFSLEFWTAYDGQVVGEMREIVSKDNQSLTSNSFLLDDDMRYPSLPLPTSSQLLVVLATY